MGMMLPPCSEDIRSKWDDKANFPQIQSVAFPKSCVAPPLKQLLSRLLSSLCTGKRKGAAADNDRQFSFSESHDRHGLVPRLPPYPSEQGRGTTP